MDLDYWTEQIKATLAIVAHLAIPVPNTSPIDFEPTAAGQSKNFAIELLIFMRSNIG